MTPFHHLLLPLNPHSPLEQMRKSLHCGIHASRWLQCGLQVACIDAELGRVENELSGFEHERLPKGKVPVVPIQGDFAEGLLRLMRQSEIDLVYVFDGISDGHPNPTRSELLPWQEALLLRSWAPILFTHMPSACDPLFTSLLVPISGEKGVSMALEVALELADQLHLPVDLVHVTEGKEGSRPDVSAVGHPSDEFHREYPKLIEEMIAQSSPYTPLRKRFSIRSFHHVYGDTTASILDISQKTGYPLVILDWKGLFNEGRAKIVKDLLGNANQSVLLVRSSVQQRSKLDASGLAS